MLGAKHKLVTYVPFIIFVNEHLQDEHCHWEFTHVLFKMKVSEIIYRDY